MRFCENCGESVSKSAKFCSKCGRRLENAPVVVNEMSVGITTVEISTEQDSPWYSEVCNSTESSPVQIKINSKTGQIMCKYLRPKKGHCAAMGPPMYCNIKPVL